MDGGVVVEQTIPGVVAIVVVDLAVEAADGDTTTNASVISRQQQTRITSVVVVASQTTVAIGLVVAFVRIRLRRSRTVRILARPWVRRKGWRDGESPFEGLIFCELLLSSIMFAIRILQCFVE